MRKITIILISVFVLNCVSYAQYKRPEDGSKINRNTNNLILGIFNPKNFSMNHSFQISMMNSMYGNVSVTSYVNSMNYKVTDKLNVSADVKLQYAPYVSSPLGNAYSTGLQNDLNGLSLSRLSVDYKVSDNSYIKLEYRKIDDMYYYNHYNDSYYDRMYR
jgi:hypothetical protein